VTVRSTELVRDLQREVRRLEDDLRAQAGALPGVERRLRADHAAAHARGRTAEGWTSWLDAQATQAAVAWVLACVFVRFCEDNDLSAQRWIAGADEAGLAAAVDAQAAWIQANPRDNDRGWLRQAFGWLRSTRAGASLLPDTDFVWWWDVSADAAEALVGFFRRRGGDGTQVVHRFGSPGWDTRFLGDLYQDLSEAARKRYALLQTPEFVEELILSQTLDPALAELGVEGFRMIDPTCGSGHFLLGAFHRLLAAWAQHAPGEDERVRVQRALDGVWGVDINAAATAIAKFRLTIAALRASGARRLDSPDAPAFRLHVGTGDSLLYGSGDRQVETSTVDGELALDEHHYGWEDIDQHPGILDRGRYHVVVGNPPYITVKDKAANKAYRARYESCHRQYAMSVPFAELFFKLAVRDDEQPGYVGQITGNSFMKREFGKKLIERFLPTVELTHVIDTSGAYIPGHGTPTVILVGRHRPPRTQTLRAVLGIRGEPSAPANPAKGLVWTSITENLNRPGTDTEYVSVVDLPRESLRTFPWSLSGGGAVDLKNVIESGGRSRIDDSVVDSGFGVVTREDEAFQVGAGALRRRHVSPEHVVPMIDGENIRDWRLTEFCLGLWPYDAGSLDAHIDEGGRHFLWPVRRYLTERVAYGKTQIERELEWFEYSMFFRGRFRTPLSVAFAFVATHNHFVLDRGGKVFKQSAPVTKLPEGASEDDHLRLLGLLNSSTACFWLKQVCHNKGSQGINEGFKSQAWERFFEFTGTKLEQFPVPEGSPLVRARRLDALAQELASVTPAGVCAVGVPTRGALEGAWLRWEAVRAEMIAVQEDLDWEVYKLYGVLDDDLSYGGADLPGLALGERAFEIVLARQVAAGEADTQWFARHGSTPVTEVPARWPAAYRELVQRRIDAIGSHPLLHLIERPECKRRWAVTPWADQQEEALRGWLLDRLEAPSLWHDDGGPRTLSAAQLADAVRAETDFRQVLDLYLGRPDYDLVREVGRLVRDEAVPYLACLRYQPAGMRKRAAWERTWALQRREDAGEDVGPIEVPPKYAPADFRSTAYWRARGKLDVPKERFVSYPGTERGGDPTAVLGWAGWDHLGRTQALARLILDRQHNDGWPASQLTEPLAGLLELEPWLSQWHDLPDPLHGGSPADFYRAFLDEQASAAGLTREGLAPLAGLVP
jgi:hypothetical protein